MATPFIGSGIQGQLVAQLEQTYGVAPALTSPHCYEFTSETLTSTKTTVQGAGLHAGGLYNRAARRVLTNWQAGGDLTLDLPTRGLNLWLQLMLGSADQSVYAKNGALAQVAGGTAAFAATHIPGKTGGTSVAVQKGVPDTSGEVWPFTYVGGKVSSWTVSVDTGAISQLQLTLDARNELAGSGNSDPLNTSVPALATWTDPKTDLFHFRQAQILTGGVPATTGGVTTIPTTGTGAATPLGQVKTASITQAMSLDTSRFFVGSAGFKAEQLENGLRSISGSMTVEWTNAEALYDAYLSDSATSLLLEWTGNQIDSSATSQKDEFLSILIPNIKLDGAPPQVSGPAVVTQSITFAGLDDEANNPIVVNYVTLDSA